MANLHFQKQISTQSRKKAFIQWNLYNSLDVKMAANVEVVRAYATYWKKVASDNKSYKSKINYQYTI